MTRKWKNRFSIMNEIKLFLIDEIHVLGELSRGAVIEAVVSRMKSFAYSKSKNKNDDTSLRFVAISATIPNIEDVYIYFLSICNNQINNLMLKNI